MLTTARFCGECGAWIVPEAPEAQLSPEATTGSAPLPKDVAQALALASQTLESGGGPKKTAIRSTPPPPNLDAPGGKKTFGRTDVARISSMPELHEAARKSTPPPALSTPSSSGNFPIASLPSLEAPQSRAAKTVADAMAPVMSAHTIARQKKPLGAFLVSFQYEPLGAYWPLGLGANLVGRAGARPDLDIGLADITVSNEQAVITVEPNVLGIEDRGSKNGTFVNGRALLGGARAPLKHGDRVRFGSFETVVVVVPYVVSGPGLSGE